MEIQKNVKVRNSIKFDNHKPILIIIQFSN